MLQGNFIGNLGSDPKERKNGCKLRVATNHRTNGDDVTTWVDVLAFGKTGENCLKYLGKGDKIYVTGRIGLDDGGENFKPSIVCFADRVEFVKTKGKSDD